MVGGAVHNGRHRQIAILVTLALGLSLLGLNLRTPAGAVVGATTFDALDGTLDPGVTTIADEPSGSTDNSFSGGGPKEDDLCPTISLSHSAPQNADIKSFSYGTQSTDPAVLYLAWERYANNGTLALDFELNQLENTAYMCAAPGAPTRTPGDLLLTYDFQGGTAANPSIVIETRRWDGSTWGAPTLLSGSHEESIRDDLLFGEIAIDLVESGILSRDVCNDFGDAWAKTRTGSSTGFHTSSIKDFVTPVATSISNCGSLTVSKSTGGVAGSFTFDVSCLAGTPPVAYALPVADTSFQLSDGQHRVIDNIPFGSACTVTETDPGSNWSTSYKVDAAATATNGRAATSTVDSDGTEIDFTNTRKSGSLTVAKLTVGGNGTFNFAVDCDGTTFDRTVDATTIGGTGTSSTISGIPTGTSCTVTETVPEGWANVGGVAQTRVVAAAETVSFSNRRLVPGISVVKTANPITIHAGDTVKYGYTVTNLGEEALSLVTLTDDTCPVPATHAGDANNDGKLDLQETWIYSCTMTLAGSTTNIATARGQDVGGVVVTDTDTKTVVVIKPAIAIAKTPSARSVEPGTTVVYTYTVTNPGDVPLSAVVVSDDKCSPVTFVRGDVNADAILQTGETWVFKCSQVQTGRADTLTNIGTATGVDALSRKVSASDTVTITVVAPAVITRPAPEVVAAPTPIQIAPAVIQSAPTTLPRTGSDVKGWLQLAGSLILLGLALVLTVGPLTRRRFARH